MHVAIRESCQPRASAWGCFGSWRYRPVRFVAPSKRVLTNSPCAGRKDADPDVPILKEAKAEYAKLK